MSNKAVSVTFRVIRIFQTFPNRIFKISFAGVNKISSDMCLSVTLSFSDS